MFENGPQGEAVVAVPDRAVGAIIGKGGEVCGRSRPSIDMNSRGACHAFALLEAWRIGLLLLMTSWHSYLHSTSASTRVRCATAQVINQIKNVVGVRIRVSGREDYMEGTRDRSVTISGPREAVAIAEQLVRISASFAACFAAS